MSQITKPLMVYLPDTRGVQVSRYGKGNLKIGPNVYTYSRLPGSPREPAIGSNFDGYWMGTCPGASDECLAICYAARVVAERGDVADMWEENSMSNDVPPIPEDATLIRLHIGGDFDNIQYIRNWRARLVERPDVAAWVYTRSWRVRQLLPFLEELRALPNVQMFASMDKSIDEMPPAGWRRAWIDGDPRAGTPFKIMAHSDRAAQFRLFELAKTIDGTKALICPEETKAVTNCEECRFCIDGNRNDVVFLQH